ncbi:FAD-binding protein [Synechococcus sp. M16CYN]|uniref:FAD-binding oxidoreductase n=1 Tax=Synechococcus sp. M16CYN TaxID=3103139 RepID=UPI003255C29C
MSIKALVSLYESFDPIWHVDMNQASLNLLNPQAADANRLGLLNPRISDLSDLLSNWSGPRPFRICSGGTSSRSAAAGQWTLNLRPELNQITWQNTDLSVWIGGGCRMGEVLQALLPYQQTIATGLSGLPGLGYILTGGMGPRSRELGLAVDHLLDIRGVWGSGESFWLQREFHGGSELWRGLCGAAPFLAVVSEVRLMTHTLAPLWVEQSSAPPRALPDWMSVAEASDVSTTLQWHWGANDRLELMKVHSKDPGTDRCYGISGLHQLPTLVPPGNEKDRLHSEVVGLLGPARSEGWRDCIPLLEDCMLRRPHPACSLSCQQLGGATTLAAKDATSFHHRDAVWKPWITASWIAGDLAMRQRSLQWLETIWSVLHPLCPGVHLAQLHDHLPFHQRELKQAFGYWLPGLQALKQQFDPAGNLPPL